MEEPAIETLLDLLDDAVARFGDRPCLSLRHDDGSTMTWSYRELDRRSRLAAWRLRTLGLEPGDRVLTWSPSTPELPAAYFGAIRAGLVIVPLDLRMSADAVSGIVASAGARHLVIGTGRDAPDPREVRLERFPTIGVEQLSDEPDTTFPADWVEQMATWSRPTPGDIWELIYTSGTTGTPKGVMLGHDNVVASIKTFYRIVPPLEHRIVSLLPLSHLLEQAVGLFYALSVGADILYIRSRHPRVIFDALRDHRVSTMIVVPQVLDLFWSAITREVEKRDRGRSFRRLRRLARFLPPRGRRLVFRSVHTQLGGSLNLFLSSGAYLPPAVQHGWEDLGITVVQGYGSTETGTGSCTSLDDHVPGTVGRPPEGIHMRLSPEGEVQFRGPTLFHGYWQDPQRTAEAYTDDGWYRTGDIGHLDTGGRLILSGRSRDIIVLPNGFNVYPEDVENALRDAGIRDAVILETRPGRIEAVVLVPGSHGVPQGGDPPAGRSGPPGEAEQQSATRAAIEAAVRAANGHLGPNQRIAGWRAWPDDDFPRTHTLKIRRDRIREWVGIATPGQG